MSLEERPWGEFHHRASMIDLDVIKTEIPSFDPHDMVPSAYMTIQTIDSEGNMGNISKTILIDISFKMGIVEILRLEQIAILRKLHASHPFSRNSAMCFLGLTRKFLI